MTTIKTYTLKGDKVIPTVVTCSSKPGIGIHLNGMADINVKESLLRVITGLVSIGYRIPGKKITIDISPSALKCDTPVLDSAIAVALLAEMGEIKVPDNWTIVGEMGLDATSRYRTSLDLIMSKHILEDNGDILWTPDYGAKDAPKGVKFFTSLTDIIGAAKFWTRK